MTTFITFLKGFRTLATELHVFIATVLAFIIFGLVIALSCALNSPAPFFILLVCGFMACAVMACVGDNN